MSAGSLTFETYQDKTAATDHTGGDFAFPLLGLFGETGSLLSEVKKKRREASAALGFDAHIREELGDVLWYLAALARRGDLPLAALAGRVMGKPVGDFSALTLPASSMAQADFEVILLRLAGAVGGLLADYEAYEDVSDYEDLIAHHLSKILHLLVAAAGAAGVTLADAAEANLQKIFDRWPEMRTYPPLFDADFPEAEQFPRRMIVDISEREIDGRIVVSQICDGVAIGDPLTDNAMEADDYRFHDVFHYAHAAVLGWSPVLRGLLKRKRKSQPLIDEAEDGARAAIIEEGIATWIFGQAKQHEFFETMGAGDLPFSLLKQVRSFAEGYEAAECPLWLWEEAILQGYEAYRFLREHRGARLIVDMEARRLEVVALPGD